MSLFNVGDLVKFQYTDDVPGFVQGKFAIYQGDDSRFIFFQDDTSFHDFHKDVKKDGMHPRTGFYMPAKMAELVQRDLTEGEWAIVTKEHSENTWIIGKRCKIRGVHDKGTWGYACEFEEHHSQFHDCHGMVDSDYGLWIPPEKLRRCQPPAGEPIPEIAGGGEPVPEEVPVPKAFEETIKWKDSYIQVVFRDDDLIIYTRDKDRDMTVANIPSAQVEQLRDLLDRALGDVLNEKST